MLGAPPDPVLTRHAAGRPSAPTARGRSRMTPAGGAPLAALRARPRAVLSEETSRAAAAPTHVVNVVTYNGRLYQVIAFRVRPRGYSVCTFEPDSREQAEQIV